MTPIKRSTETAARSHALKSFAEYEKKLISMQDQVVSSRISIPKCLSRIDGIMLKIKNIRSATDSTRKKVAVTDFRKRLVENMMKDSTLPITPMIKIGIWELVIRC